MSEQSERTNEPRKKWPRWARPFLAALSMNGNVRQSCQAAQISRDMVYKLRNDDEKFRESWAAALEDATDILEAEARRRACEGVDEPQVFQGRIQGTWVDKDGVPFLPTEEREPKPADGDKFIPETVKKYSDSLLTLLLKANNPAKFKDRQEITGGGGGPVGVQIYLPDNKREEPKDA